MTKKEKDNLKQALAVLLMTMGLLAWTAWNMYRIG